MGLAGLARWIGGRKATWPRAIGWRRRLVAAQRIRARQVAGTRWLATEFEEKVAGGSGDPEGEARSRWRGLGFQKWKGKVYI